MLEWRETTFLRIIATNLGVSWLDVTEPSRRYISDKTVGGFINVPSTSHICPRGDIVR